MRLSVCAQDSVITLEECHKNTTARGLAATGGEEWFRRVQQHKRFSRPPAYLSFFLLGFSADTIFSTSFMMDLMSASFNSPFLKA